MLATVSRASRSGVDRFLLLHALVIPAGFALVALAAHSSGLDERVSAAFFDAGARVFPARGWAVLETLGHRVAKSAIIAVWLTLFGAAVAAAFVRGLRQHAAILWATVLAMALGPSIVVLLKDLNAYHCPWDLKRFGGIAEHASGWFVSNGNAGRCFPSGHAAAGFSLIALFFAGVVGRNRTLRSAGLVCAVAAGAIFSLVRIAQGAHFLSHNLWSAAIDWCAAALVFTPLLVAAGRAPNPVAPSTDGDLPGARELPPKASPSGWYRLALAARYSLNGLRTAYRREAAFRQEAAGAAVCVPVALFASVTSYERAALLASLLLVLIVELLNTAIEAVVDLVSPDRHPLAAAAKDAGSAAVLLSITGAVVVWVIVFLWPVH